MQIKTMNISGTRAARNYPLLTALLFIILFSILAFISHSKPPGDYANYYFGSKYYLEGTFNSDVYEAWKLNERIRNEGYEGIFINFSTLPPSIVLFWTPFTFLPLYLSKTIFNFFSICIFIFSFLRLCRHLKINSPLLLLIPFVFLLPIRNNFLFGQTYLLLFSLFAEGFIASENKRYSLASVLWSVTVLMKIFPVLIFLYLFLNRKWKMMIWFSVTLISFSTIAYFIIDADVWKVYFTEVFPRIPTGEIHDSFTYIYQTMYMFLKELFVYDELLNPDPLVVVPGLNEVLHTAFVCTLLYFVVTINLKKEVSSFTKFSFLLFFSLLFSAYGSTYSLFLLTLPLLAYIGDNKSFGIKELFLFAALFFACNIPVHFLGDFPTVLKYPRLFLLLIVLTVIILHLRPTLRWKILIPVILIPASIKAFNFKQVQDDDAYYYDREHALLIFDYKVKGDTLNSYFLSDKGVESFALPFQDILKADATITIKENQLYVDGMKLTDSPDRKLLPMRLNDDEVLYLSDKHRGVGFYTLRRLRLPK